NPIHLLHRQALVSARGIFLVERRGGVSRWRAANFLQPLGQRWTDLCEWRCIPICAQPDDTLADSLQLSEQETNDIGMEDSNIIRNINALEAVILIRRIHADQTANVPI